ncbi:MAG TPA: M20/M25/M40 family metallo-hydrolase [Pyrinomonadaceae bacterium]|nr:M20/M25/M40 family metallo-hydrolase [Pyrinomonadaceae bacterium]
MLRRFVLVLVLTASLVGQLPAVYAQHQTSGGAAATAASTTQPSSLAVARRHADQITAAQLKDYLYFVASDEMEGRDTPSRGLDLTAKFLATNLSRWGLKPAGDNGTFFQRIALQRVKLDAADTSLDVNGRKFSFGDGILAQPIAGTASAPLVFVNHGWVVKAKNMDPYQGVDVKDKIVVVLGGGLPKGVTFADLSNGKQGVDWITPDVYAETHGARGLIAIPNKQLLANWDRLRQNFTSAGTVTVEKFKQPNEGAKIPRITISEKTLEALMQGEKQTAAVMLDRDQAEAIKAFDFSADKKVSLAVATQTEQIFTQNVVAIAEGRDSVLKNEYVAVGAHYDHVGTGAPGGAGRAPSLKGDMSDSIWNGADDDGSGTVALLAMAETLAKNPPPKRSVLFVWHCAEEKGLWGSQYFVENPTVPLDKIVTQINLDMIGRSRPEGDTNPANAKLAGPNEIYVIGSKMMSTQLGELSENTNHAYLNLKLNYLYDDPKDPNQFFYRSDHFNYAKHGIPIIFYFDGEHEDYHRPGDHPEKIDYQKMERVTRTVFVTLWELAERPTRPVVDKPLPKDVTGDN